MQGPSGAVCGCRHETCASEDLLKNTIVVLLLIRRRPSLLERNRSIRRMLLSRELIEGRNLERRADAIVPHEMRRGVRVERGYRVVRDASLRIDRVPARTRASG